MIDILEKINEGRVESSAGYSIHIIGLEIIKYEDKKHSIEFEWNYDPKLNKTYIYVTDEKGISNEEKINIIKNIKEAAKLLTGNYEVL